MKIVKTFVFSCALLAQLSASVLPSVVERFKTDDYVARENARVELMAAFAESTVSQFDSVERRALELELLEQVQSDAIPLPGRLYMLRMLELYGSSASVGSLSELAQAADPILSEAAKRASLAVQGIMTPLQVQASDATTALGQLSAYDDLLATDPARALEVASQVLNDSDAVGCVRILTAAAQSDHAQVRDAVLPAMLAGTDVEKMIAVVAIAELNLSEYEAAVLEILPTTGEQLRNESVACLGVIGSDDSFTALYALYEINPKALSVQSALARVGAPSADAQALRDAVEASDSQAQMAAVKLLALRNPAGGTPLLNGLLQDSAGMNAEVLKSVYQTLEQIGDVESIHLMLKPELLLSDHQRETQRSLKRLSLSLGIPDYLWAEAYQAGLSANPSADYRAAVLEIIDGVACEGSVSYLKAILENPTSPDYALAYRSLQRWPQEQNLYAADMWLIIYQADTATDADRQKAEDAVKKLLKNRHPDFYPAQINLLLEVGQSDLPVEFKNTLFGVYAEPSDHFYSWYFPSAKRLLQPALNTPDVAGIAQQIIDKL